MTKDLDVAAGAAPLEAGHTPKWRLHIDIGILLNILQAHVEMTGEDLSAEDFMLVASIQADYRARAALTATEA